jgi:hypothetical protein
LVDERRTPRRSPLHHYGRKDLHVKLIRIPKLLIPSNLDEIIANQKPRPLDICTTCRYVRCSCGKCHSQQCAQPCGHESNEAATTTQAVELDADGKTWCAQCQGNYYPHEH